MSQEFGGGKILKVLVISDNINWSWRSFKAMLPNFKSFEDGQEFLVVYIVVQLHGVENPGVESNWMYLVVGWRYYGQDCCKSVIRGVSFDNEWGIRNPMHEDRSSHEGFFEYFK